MIPCEVHCGSGGNRKLQTQLIKAEAATSVEKFTKTMRGEFVDVLAPWAVRMAYRVDRINGVDYTFTWFECLQSSWGNDARKMNPPIVGIVSSPLRRTFAHSTFHAAFRFQTTAVIGEWLRIGSRHAANGQRQLAAGNMDELDVNVSRVTLRIKSQRYTDYIWKFR